MELLNVSQATAKLDDDEKLIYALYISGQYRDTLLVSEPGVYALIAKSRKPQAKVFDRWVRHDVLPSIRKNGYYGIQVQLQPQLPQTYLDALKALVRTEEEKLAEAEGRRIAEEQNKMLVAENQVLLPKAESHDHFMQAENCQDILDSNPKLDSLISNQPNLRLSDYFILSSYTQIAGN